MPELLPRYLLWSSTCGASCRRESHDRWQFVLQAVDSPRQIAADDREPGISRDRLELLAAVRGLEALEQPSRVKLFTSSRYVASGLREGLAKWREAGWTWEWFGRRRPIRSCDLWLRIDQALQYHEVLCRLRPMGRGELHLRQDGSHTEHLAARAGAASQRRRTTLRRRSDGWQPPRLYAPLATSATGYDACEASNSAKLTQVA